MKYPGDDLKELCFSGVITLALVFSYSLLIAASSLGGTSYAFRMSIIMHLCMESNAFLKSIYTMIAFLFRVLTPSISLRSASMCEVVDQPGRNPF